MEFKPVFYSLLVLCLIAFFEVLITMRKRSMLKICFIILTVALFIMNYYSYVGITNRIEFILVKSMRVIYVTSLMLAIIHLVSPKIPRSIIIFTSISVCVLIGLRIYFYNQINLEGRGSFSNIIFSVGNELYHPFQLARYIVMFVVLVATSLIFYYYRQFFLKQNTENIYYNQLSRWIISLVVPFFLLAIFAILAVLNLIHETIITPYLFSFFSCTTILSILFRPKFLNRSRVGLAFINMNRQAGPNFTTHSFNHVFFNEYYYLDKNASIAQLAEKLNTTETDLREFLQQEYGMGINDFLNKHRIGYMVDLLNDPGNKDFTIEYVSQKAGFPSRSTMYRAFSKFHGGNPTDYIANLRH
jgi:AraC-like DNA-binding protein